MTGAALLQCRVNAARARRRGIQRRTNRPTGRAGEFRAQITVAAAYLHPVDIRSEAEKLLKIPRRVP